MNSIKRLSSKQKDLCWHVTESIIASKNVNDWQSDIPDWIQNPTIVPNEETLEIATEHNVSIFLAGLLKESKI
jgi:hypothetical protein